MGDYTGLRFAAQLSPRGLEIIKCLNELRFDPTCPANTWGAVAKRHPWPELRLWAQVGRCDFIPFGAIEYMPKDWMKSGGGSARRMSKLEGSKWLVTCSLKNYEDEIETFLSVVLPALIEAPCTVEVLYEEWDEPELVLVEPRAPQLSQ